MVVSILQMARITSWLSYHLPITDFPAKAAPPLFLRIHRRYSLFTNGLGPDQPSLDVPCLFHSDQGAKAPWNPTLSLPNTKTMPKARLVDFSFGVNERALNKGFPVSLAASLCSETKIKELRLLLCFFHIFFQKVKK